MLHPSRGYFGLAPPRSDRGGDCASTTVIGLEPAFVDYATRTIDPCRSTEQAEAVRSRGMVRYLTLHELADRVGITYNTAKGYLRKGVLPEADASIGPKLGWLPKTVDEWMDSRPGRGRWGRHDTPLH